MAGFFKTLFKPEENIAIVKLFLNILNVRITTTTLTKELEEHPDYPSLLSVSDVLSNNGVENMTLKVNVAEFENIPLPCIAVVDEENSSDNLSIIKSIASNNVEYYNTTNNTWQSISKENFLKKWPSQIVLIADAEKAISEKDYTEKRKEEKLQLFTRITLYLLLPLITLLTCLLAILNSGFLATGSLIFTLLTLSGCIVSSLLMWYEIDEHNAALQQICSGGKKVNCSAILNSKASKIAGISWSVIGFAYFAGALLLLLYFGINNIQSLFIISWLNVLATPYIIFSIYYQWRVAKQWCVLCLAVQCLLALQLIISVAASWQTAVALQSIFSYKILMPALLSYAVPFIIANLLIPAYKAAKENKTSRQELQRLKHNKQIFEALLAKQKQLSNYPEGLGILLGNPEANNKIIKVCNPYCSPCAMAHVPMEALLENNPDVQVQIIFTATNNANDAKAPPVKHLLAIAATSNNEAIIKHALDDWYLADKKDYAVFASKHPMNGELKKQDDKVEAMSAWCDKVGIEFTPTFFINGYQLPEIYNMDDLKYFLTI